MELNFLFLDECFNSTLKISSLTGVIVPTSIYPELRSQFYNILEWSIRPAPNVIGPAPELHGNDFLRDKDDERKLEVLNRVADLIIDNNLQIYRIGYYITRYLEDKFSSDKKLLGLCWTSLLVRLEPVLEKSMIIPVMDGFEPSTVQGFSGVVKSADHLRAAGLGRSLSIRNSSNILGEVFYADSLFSIFIQVADVVSYLRNASDMDKAGKEISDFKAKLVDVSDRLVSAIAYEDIIAMTFNGVTQGPPEHARQASDHGPITQAVDIK